MEATETDGKTDEVASYEAWNKHILRNESFIQDLFGGQFRSKLTCSVCKRISITFDPFTMVSVPIVSVNYCDVDGYLMSYHVNESYQNFRFKVRMRDNQRMYDVRQKL